MFSKPSLVGVVLVLVLSMDVVAARGLRRKHRHKTTPPAAAAKIGPVDTTFADLRWTSEKGEVRVNGEPYHIKGIAWFGMEDDGASLHGLDKKPMSYIFDFLTKERFNAIRLTVSLDFALHLDAAVVNYDHLQKLQDKDLWNSNRGELLSKVIDKAGEAGFMVVVDMHRLTPYDQGELWYGLGYSEDNFLEGWNRLVQLVGKKWNVMGLDLKNEPRGRSTWGTGQNETDWGMAATRIIKNLTAEHPEYKGLFMVEGVENPTGTWQTSNGRWWGGDLEGIKQNPINLGNDDLNKRVVYAPHIYGPGQYMMDYFVASSFPTNLPGIFDSQWGFAEKLTGRAVVIGEWGGNIGAQGVTGDWARALVDYMVSHCIADSFFWSLNPDSLDTGGLLKTDWTTPDTGKLSLLSTLQPEPSRLRLTRRDPSTNATTFSFTRGRHADPTCAPPKAEPPKAEPGPIAEVPGPTTSPQP